ncbi:MAG: holo-ACP synthase [Candidatus Omnitrophica bacterium]|nr:holo-ACP synthase [Candidatus Omnitrophota bacterium]
MIVGIGIDVASKERIGSLFEKHGERFLKRVFTEVEREYCLSFSEPVVHLAARFAAKEAAYKALGGVGPIRWKEMEVKNDERGRPWLTLHAATKDLADSLGVSRNHLTLAHDAGIAMAEVILEG